MMGPRVGSKMLRSMLEGWGGGDRVADGPSPRSRPLLISRYIGRVRRRGPREPARGRVPRRRERQVPARQVLPRRRQAEAARGRVQNGALPRAAFAGRWLRLRRLLRGPRPEERDDGRAGRPRDLPRAPERRRARRGRVAQVRRLRSERDARGVRRGPSPLRAPLARRATTRRRVPKRVRRVGRDDARALGAVRFARVFFFLLGGTGARLDARSRIFISGAS